MTGLYVANNVQSLISQNQLRKNMGELGNILTRLSTGLRINSGKDDPAGLISSELLKSDITATNKAISNTQRANSVIAIADSSLGQVSSLLIDIKALIVEGANTGAMNADQIKANQLQIDASLDSIDRISKTTNYQGQLLLDGSMDFQTTGVSNAAVRDLKVHEANFGTLSQIDVSIDVLGNAERARLYYDKSGISTEVVLEVGGNLGTDVFKFAAGTSVADMAKAINQVSDSTGVQAVVGDDATYGQILITSAGFDNDINIRALTAGAAGGAYSFKFTAGNSEKTTYSITEPIGDQSGIVEFKLKMQEKTAPKGLVDESLIGLYTYDITGDPTGGGIVVQTTDGSVINHTKFIDMGGTGTPGVSATYDKSTGLLQIQYNGSADDDELELAINSIPGFELLDGGVADLPGGGTLASADLRANNALNVTAGLAGTKFENTDIVYFKGVEDPANDVEFEYKDGARSAAATIRWTDDTQMRIVANSIGADMNDVTIVFEQDDTDSPGEVSAVYDENRKTLHIRGQVDNLVDSNNASFAAIKSAVEAASDFRVEVTDSNGDAYPLSQKVLSGLVTGTGLATGYETTPNTVDNAYIKTGRHYEDIGTDHQALFIRVADDTITANDVVTALNDPANAAIKANFDMTTVNSGTGTLFSADWDDEIDSRVFTSALTGGADGLTTAVTAQELVELINCDPVLSQLFHADVALGQYGLGYVTLFDEAAYYGDPNEETSLQFLGPSGSPDILFVTDGPNSELGISFGSGPLTNASDSRTIASSLSKNANAAFSVQALNGGDYENMAVRLIRLDNNHTAADGYVQYKTGPSNVMAYCSIVETDTGTADEVGKFIVYGKEGGEALNNVAIVAKLNVNQAEPVVAYYDENNKQLIVSVNSENVTLTEAVAAINASTPFQAEYDYSFNRDTGNSGPGSATFDSLFLSSPTVEIGNTYNTGGYNGVLEVYVGGEDDEITAQLVVDTINNDEIAKKLFAAATIGTGAEAGTGLIDFRHDNFRETVDDCGKTIFETNLVTETLGKDESEEGYMIIHLATDENGSPITTARELVDFMNSLTAQQTRGISVSLVRPAGRDNLLRTWTTDNCGNVVETQECDDDFGKGILQPTMEIDECDIITYYPIEFYSFGENLVDGRAYGSVVAQGGVDASLRIYARQPGTGFNGVGFKYVLLADAQEKMYTEYDSTKKEITVYIHDGTTAVEVKNLIETSEETKDLFTAELVGNGTGIVSAADDYLVTKRGEYDAGYRGGAHMLGANDADPHSLIFESAEEGSDQRVTVRTITGNFQLKDANGNYVETTYGVDMTARLNGVLMSGFGRNLSVNSSVLKLDIALDQRVLAGDTIRFSLTGGGATFQIGPDVVTNQQIRLGLSSVNTAKLGGASGRLYQLRSGNDADLMTNTKLADRIIEEAILSISTLRGRLGAIQRSTLDPTINSLQDSLQALTTAEAQISNADFAEESSRLTRAQILIQAGAQTLQIANQLPQYAAMLIG